MAHQSSIIELRNMQVADLTRESRGLRNEVAKMKIGINLGKQKNTGDYRDAKRQLARMLTVLTNKQKTEKSEKTEQTEVAQSAPSSQPSKKKAINSSSKK